MVSRENKVIVAFIALAILSLYVLAELSIESIGAGGAVIIGVGVVAPLLVNNYLDRRGRS